MTRAQRALWARGDFHRIGVSQVSVGEMLVRALHVHAGERVLDVAGGAGNTALAAARRCAEVTCTDIVPALLLRARDRAAAEGLPLSTGLADAQALPFPDGSFDVVTSTFGAMFAPDQDKAAASCCGSCARVAGSVWRTGHPTGGWAPSSTYQLTTCQPCGPAPRRRWRGVHGSGWTTCWAGTSATWRSPCSTPTSSTTAPEASSSCFTHWFGPVATAWSRMTPDQAAACAVEWVDVADRYNIATDGTCEIPAAYLQVVAVKAA